MVGGPQLQDVEFVAAAVEPVGERARAQVGRMGPEHDVLARRHVEHDLGTLTGRDQQPV